MTTLDECIGDARDTIIEQAEYDRAFLAGMSRERCLDWLNEHTHEATDGAVPVYNADIMEVAADSRVWSQDNSDFGEPRDLIQAAQWAIYQAIEEAINEDESLLAAICDIAEEAETTAEV